MMKSRRSQFIRMASLGLAAGLAIASLISLTSFAAERSRLPKGTDILHYFIRKELTRAEGETNASGRLEIKQNAQGHANNQRLELLVRHLEPAQTYHLLAWMGDDTNATYIAAFTAEDDGDLSVRYRQQANGHGQGLGHGRLPLPAALDPVSQIRRLEVANSSTQTVASADTATPEKLQYLVKRRLTNQGVDLDAEALLRLKANNERARLELFVIGLDGGTNYWLALNGEATAPLNTDALGRASYQLLLEPSLQALAIHELAIWTSESNVVLRTQLP
jgi:hypothetical protein